MFHILRSTAAFLSAVIITAVSAFGASAEDMSEISAKSAVVINAQTGEVLFEKNAYEILPMASTTKIMSALIVLEQDDLDKKFVVDSNAIMTEGSSMGLVEGDIVSLRDLACGMLLPSGNDAANAAAVRVAGSVDGFVDMMNERAEKMGLDNTHFVTTSGLDDYTDEHYSTAYDMAVLTREAMKNDDFRDICSQSQIRLNFGNPPFDRWLTNTNKLLRYSDDFVGVKTGFTDKARRCLVSACDRKGAELICVTLNAPDDWNDHTRLYDYCFDFISEQRIDPPAYTFEVSVAGGESDVIECVTESCTAVLLNGRADRVTAEVYLKPFVYAPVNAGDKIGEIVYRYNGIEIARKDITSAGNVVYVKTVKKSVTERIWQKTKKLLGLSA